MADSSFRHRQQDRPPGGRQRWDRRREIAHPLRLQGHRRDDRVAGRARHRDLGVGRRPGPAVLDVFKTKLVKRDVSLKVLDASEPRRSGQQSKIAIALKGGHLLRGRQRGVQAHHDGGPKGVKAQIQGDELRVSSKRDDLQAVIAWSRHRTTTSRCSSPNYR